jgi:aconitate hydratase
VIGLDLSAVEPSLAGPKRPQDRIPLPRIKSRFAELFATEVAGGGYGRKAADLGGRVAVSGAAADVGHGDVLIAAITSCTNTSNPACSWRRDCSQKKRWRKA